MNRTARPKRRLVVIVILAVGLLLALVFATGGGFPTAISTTPTPIQDSVQITPTPITGKVQGEIRVWAHRLTGTTWQFVYTVRDTGKVPLAGFQLNATTANLFRIRGLKGWNYFGTGVCHGQPKGVLIYWSTLTGGSAIIQPGGTAVFRFQVNTSGTHRAGFSLSYGNAAPLFGKTLGPAPSTLPVTELCNS